jgi:hypothetical protein
MKSARERLAELIEPALEGLHKALKSKNLPTIVRASQIVLDRCGFHPSQAIEFTEREGGPVEVVNTISLERLSLEEKRTLLEILEKAGAGEGNELAPIYIRTD